MREVLAWALYDLANTFFAVAMLSIYFPLWVVEDRGGKELWFSLALGASMACVALLMPVVGALSDAMGRRMGLLRWTTYGCAALTALIGGTTHLGMALVLFGIANVCYQLGTVVYDALLWRVASPGRLGLISGLGAAFGYLGSALGLLALWPFVRAGGYQGAFAPAAAGFLLLALPSFWLIREPPGLRVAWPQAIGAAVRQVVRTVRSARAAPGLWRYFWAAFFSLNAIQTVLAFMAVYLKRVAGFTDDQLVPLFLTSQLSAVAGSLLLGLTVGRWGAKRTLAWIWLGWIAALGVAAISPTPRWFWLVGPLIGFCLGSTWATSRVLVTELAPKTQLAEMFGLAGLFARMSAILGPLAWGIVVWDPARYRLALVMPMTLLAVGLWLLRRVPSVAVTADR
jgi:UMF1 family MFS transporter